MTWLYFSRLCAPIQVPCRVFRGPVDQQHVQHHPRLAAHGRVASEVVERCQAEQVEVMVVRRVVLVHPPGDLVGDPLRDPPLRLPTGGGRGAAVRERRAVRPGLREEVPRRPVLEAMVVGEARVGAETPREALPDRAGHLGRQPISQPEHGVHHRVGLERGPRLRVVDRFTQVTHARRCVRACVDLRDAEVDPLSTVFAGRERLRGDGRGIRPLPRPQLVLIARRIRVEPLRAWILRGARKRQQTEQRQPGRHGAQEPRRGTERYRAAHCRHHGDRGSQAMATLKSRPG